MLGFRELKLFECFGMHVYWELNICLLHEPITAPISAYEISAVQAEDKFST